MSNTLRWRNLKTILLGVYISEVEQAMVSLIVGSLMYISDVFPIDQVAENLTGVVLIACGSTTLMGSILRLKNRFWSFSHYAVRGIAAISWMWTAIILLEVLMHTGKCYPSFPLFAWHATLIARSIAMDINAKRAVRNEWAT